MSGVIGSLIALAMIIAPLWRICGRAGFNPALSLFVIIPIIGNLIISGVLGFAEWPSSKAGREPGTTHF